MLMKASEPLAALRAEVRNLLHGLSPKAIATKIEFHNGWPVLVSPEGAPPVDPAVIRWYREVEGF